MVLTDKERAIMESTGANFPEWAADINTMAELERVVAV